MARNGPRYVRERFRELSWKLIFSEVGFRKNSQTIKSASAVQTMFTRVVILGVANIKISRNCFLSRFFAKLHIKWAKPGIKEEKRCEETLTWSWEPWSSCNSINLQAVSHDRIFSKMLLLLAKTVMYCNWMWFRGSMQTVLWFWVSALRASRKIQGWTGQVLASYLQPNVSRWV